VLVEGEKTLSLEDLPESTNIRGLIECLRSKHLTDKEEIICAILERTFWYHSDDERDRLGA